MVIKHSFGNIHTSQKEHFIVDLAERQFWTANSSGVTRVNSPTRVGWRQERMHSRCCGLVCSHGCSLCMLAVWVFRRRHGLCSLPPGASTRCARWPSYRAIQQAGRSVSGADVQRLWDQACGAYVAEWPTERPHGCFVSSCGAISPCTPDLGHSRLGALYCWCWLFNGGRWCWKHLAGGHGHAGRLSDKECSILSVMTQFKHDHDTQLGNLRTCMILLWHCELGYRVWVMTWVQTYSRPKKKNMCRMLWDFLNNICEGQQWHMYVCCVT